MFLFFFNEETENAVNYHFNFFSCCSGEIDDTESVEFEFSVLESALTVTVSKVPTRNEYEILSRGQSTHFALIFEVLKRLSRLKWCNVKAAFDICKIASSLIRVGTIFFYGAKYIIKLINSLYNMLSAPPIDAFHFSRFFFRNEKKPYVSHSSWLNDENLDLVWSAHRYPQTLGRASTAADCRGSELGHA